MAYIKKEGLTKKDILLLKEKYPRNYDALNRHLFKGETQRGIGKREGISGTRVRQLIWRGAWLIKDIKRREENEKNPIHEEPHKKKI